ncbi:hypothetical protein ACFZB5_07595 [Streptomyces nodosus]|uniref:hypothetical protein n=1 Tax=Streptomyces nodosus TaxID=40318 RepID=UPI0036EE87EE
MADEQHGWLSDDAAERLLRGEPPTAVDDVTRANIARLSETLAALAATPPPTGAELPGEAAALAAFRAARTNGNGAAAGQDGRRDPAALSADTGLVRLGRPDAGRRKAPRGRRARFGLAAVMTAGMIGGAAVAAGTGVLRTPLGDAPGTAASASVSPAGTSEQPPSPPAPQGPATGGSPSPTAGSTSGAPGQVGPSYDAADDDSAPTGGLGGAGASAGGREWWSGLRSSCSDLAGGKELDAERRRSLEDAAGGKSRVKGFCKGVLGGEDRARSGGTRGSGKGGNGRDHRNGDQGDQGDQGNQGSQGNQGNQGKQGGQGDQGGNGGGDQGGNGGDGEDHRGPGGPGLAATPSAVPHTAPPPSRRWGTRSPHPTYGARNAFLVR